MKTKRTFRKLTGKKTYRKWAQWELDDSIVCKFLREESDQYKKPAWIVEIIEVDFNDVDAQEKFKPGTVVSLNSMGMLDGAMEELETGDVVQVLYTGMEEMGKGPHEGEAAHTVEVSVAEGDEEPQGEDEEEISGL